MIERETREFIFSASTPKTQQQILKRCLTRPSLKDLKIESWLTKRNLIRAEVRGHGDFGPGPEDSLGCVDTALGC